MIELNISAIASPIFPGRSKMKLKTDLIASKIPLMKSVKEFQRFLKKSTTLLKTLMGKYKIDLITPKDSKAIDLTLLVAA